MFNSIRWKFTTIYFMLVFIGMIIAGVFIVRAFETFNLNEVTQKLESLSELMLPQLGSYENWDDNADDIQQIIMNHKEIGLREEIFVIDKLTNTIIATSTQNKDKKAMDILDFNLIINGFTAKQDKSLKTMTQNSTSGIKTMDLVRPIVNKNNQTIGVLYLRYDLSDHYLSINTSKTIIMQATLLASVITVILGFFIAKTITEPINDVTKKAAKMASGDFDQVVAVKSDDEIGKLAEMFNYLTKRLKVSMSEISREKSKLEAIIHYMDDGLIAANSEGVIIHLNPKAIKMLNINPNVKNLDDVFLDINEDLLISNIIKHPDSLVGNRNIVIGESIIRVNFAPFSNDRDVRSGLVFVLQDITEQEKLDRMRRDFVANVSHELKTPLTSIKSYTETILDGVVTDPDTVHEFLEVVNNEADRMTRLVRDLLQLSNFDAKTVSLDLAEHDYVNMVKKAVQKVEVTAKQKMQQITLISDDGYIFGYFDHDRIEQVVLNILSNAIKYTPEGGDIKVYISRQNDQAVFKVKDTGMGIPEKDLSRIFERFYRVDKARARALGGTGLGLSIAKHIVEGHGGGIAIESEVDFGTVVSVMLPLDNREYDP